MKRRDFLRYGSVSMAGLTMGASELSWIAKDAQAAGTPWKFGVMADTQWDHNIFGGNSGNCAQGIIKELNKQFIAHGCRFVIQVGDLVDEEEKRGNRNLPVRASAAQPLYNAGIDFMCCRGNHESSSTAAGEIPALFPQHMGQGSHCYSLDNVIDSDKSNLRGLSYAFDVDNVRVVMLDQFSRQGGGSGVLDQLDWVDQVLENRPSDMHAIVMAHKNLAGQGHDDTLFGSNPGSNAAQRCRFIRSLQSNKVGYFQSGHDHMHHRSIIHANDGNGEIEQIISSSNSYKFYAPFGTPSSQTYNPNHPETVISQELYTIGYYIYTVDGPWVTVDFYSSKSGLGYYGIGLLFDTPDLDHFYHRERFGYSLNGKSFTIQRGEYYDAVQDTYEGTSAKILAGRNNNNESDASGRHYVKTVKTGWKSMPLDAASAELRLWGMMDNLSLHEASSKSKPRSDESDTCEAYTLSMSYDPTRISLRALRAGLVGIKARNSANQWVDAVNLNSGGSKQFVYGPYNGHGLGSYGVDPRTETVWAVLNHDGAFVAK